MPKFAPENFKPTEANQEWAKTKFGISSEEVSNQTEQFIDYEFKRSYTDWQRCWRNWIRKADQLGMLKRDRAQPVDMLAALHKAADGDEQRQEDLKKWREDMRRFKVVK